MFARVPSFRSCLSPPRRRRSRGFSAQPAAAEVLEQRRLMTIIDPPAFNGVHDFEVIGRASDGGWYSGSFDGGGPMANQAFANWNAAVNWKDVTSGDFDGDGLGDLVGRDAATGNWYTTMSDMVGSTTKLGVHWNPDAGWTDVMAADLAGAGDRNPSGDGDPNNFNGHFTHKSDFVGRSSDGTWWAAVSNGDGTFSTVALTRWAPAAGWTDVKIADVNGDNAEDIIGRTSTGQWWAATSKNLNQQNEGVTYENTFLGQWNPSAGWQDTTLTNGQIWSRTNTGQWWVLELPGDGTANTHFGAQWNEAAGWHDVKAVQVGHQATEIVARTSTGQWWKMTPGGSTSFIGAWNEAAGWQDVVVGANPGDTTFDIAGRTATGDWWVSSYNGAQLGTPRLVGNWNPNAAWQDVRFERVTRPVVAVVRNTDELNPGFEQIVVSVQGHRSGTQATMTELTSVAGKQGIKIHYVVPATGLVRDFTIFATVDNPAWNIMFDGQVGSDVFSSTSQNIQVHMRGWAGADDLSADIMIANLDGGDGKDKINGVLEP